MATVLHRQGDVPLIALQRGRREVAPLPVVRQPSAQVAREVMSMRVADAAAFDLAHLRGVYRRFLPACEVLRAILQAAVRPRHSPPALPSDRPLACSDSAKRRHVVTSFCWSWLHGMSLNTSGRRSGG